MAKQAYKVPVAYTGARSQDAKDCAVRALANVASLPYVEAFDSLSKEGRIKGRGSQLPTMTRAYRKHGIKLVKTYGKAWYYGLKESVSHSDKGITFGKLVKTLTKGRFIVVYTGHAVAVVDGQVIDTFDSPAGKHVMAVYKLES